MELRQAGAFFLTSRANRSIICSRKSSVYAAAASLPPFLFVPVTFGIFALSPGRVNALAQFWCNITSLESTFPQIPASVDSKPLTETLNPLDATLMKNSGEGSGNFQLDRAFTALRFTPL